MSHKTTKDPAIRIRVAGEDDLAAVTRVAGRDTSQPRPGRSSSPRSVPRSAPQSR